jgi:dihydropteroate synthase
MGILNLTPDSFSDGSKYNTIDRAIAHVEHMLADGADIIDVGAVSTRPNAPPVPEDEEKRRLFPILDALLKRFPDALFSLDTFRSSIAQAGLEHGVHIINDISGGQFDPLLWETVAKYQCPYVLMHIQGTPQTMQQNPVYQDVVLDIYSYFVERIQSAQAKGIKEIIIDPGFGFGKTFEHNTQLFQKLHLFKTLPYPLLIGISRKSWVRTLSGSNLGEWEKMVPVHAALHWHALLQGVNILRVHEVKPAVQIRDLFLQLQPQPYGPALSTPF